MLSEFKENVGQILVDALSTKKREATLRMSSIGQPCERKLWYEINEKEKGEELRPETKLKFLYGHLLEEILLFLASAAGHEVTGRQTELDIEGIKGHRDAIIDGVLVDVKSASSYSFKKFQSGGLSEDDPFGYLTQINAYFHASKDDPLLRDHERVAFFVVDKTLGHITLDYHTPTDENLSETFLKKKELVQSEEIPERGFTSVPFQQGGNEKLGLNCSYCPFKASCWPESRTFLYSTGPITLVKVVKEPNVPELHSSLNSPNGEELRGPIAQEE